MINISIMHQRRLMDGSHLCGDLRSTTLVFLPKFYLELPYDEARFLQLLQWYPRMRSEWKEAPGHAAGKWDVAGYKKVGRSMHIPSASRKILGEWYKHNDLYYKRLGSNGQNWYSAASSNWRTGISYHRPCRWILVVHSLCVEEWHDFHTFHDGRSGYSSSVCPACLFYTTSLKCIFELEILLLSLLMDTLR